MAVATTTWTSPWVVLHGAGVANCGSYPEIGVKLTIKFSRSEGSTTVSWEVTDIDWYHPTTGYYGYEFISNISVGGASLSYSNEIIRKNNTTASNWWNYTSTNKPSGSFTSSNNVTSVSFYAEGGHCLNSYHGFCYGSSGDCYIEGFTNVPIPAAETLYPVTYNANGGTGAPASQNKSSLSALTLSTKVPTYPLTVNYYNNGTTNPTVTTVYRQFNNWKGSDNNTYSPGGSYTTNAACTMTAQWGNATFTPIAMPTQYLTLTMNPNGGTISKTSKTFARQSLGYGTSASATTPSYVPGQSGTTSTNLNLYPIYGSAIINRSDLVTPTRDGYVFDSWFTDAACTNRITFPYAISSNTTIYAGWTELPVHFLIPGGTWKGNDLYIWRFDGTSWQKVAHPYKYSSDGWHDMVPATQPPDIFNHGGLVGLDPFYSTGMMVYREDESNWVITDTEMHTKTARGNLAVSFGGLCNRGEYQYLCAEVAVTNGVAGNWNNSQFGPRYVSKGHDQGGSADSKSKTFPSVYAALTSCYDHTNYTHTEPWNNLPRQVVKFNLSTLTSESFYINFHVCDCIMHIYSMWFE